MANDKKKDTRSELQQYLAVKRNDEGKPMVDHVRMDFPEDMQDVKYSTALNKSKHLDSDYDKWMHWVDYRRRLRGALNKRFERLKEKYEGPPPPESGEFKYYWYELLNKVEDHVDKHFGVVNAENSEGGVKPKSTRSTPPETKLNKQIEEAEQKNETPRKLVVKVGKEVIKNSDNPAIDLFYESGAPRKELWKPVTDANTKFTEIPPTNLKRWLKEAWKGGEYNDL